MAKIFSPRSFRPVWVSFLVLVAALVPSFAQNNKILGGYFEEWSIYYAGYNIANLEQNGVAGKLTHLMYAFANVTTTPAAACSLADTWADYQSPYLPSVNGQAYPTLRKLCCDPTAQGTPSQPEGIDVHWWRICGKYSGVRNCRQHGGRTAGTRRIVH